MAKILIPKRVSLEFLGEEFKDSYLIFKAMAWHEYERMLPEVEANDDNIKSANTIKEAILKHFIEGKFKGEAVEKEDLLEFDIDTLTKCFEVLTGQVPPKD